MVKRKQASAKYDFFSSSGLWAKKKKDAKELRVEAWGTTKQYSVTQQIFRDMDNTMLIKLTNKKAEGLLRELEELHIIKVLKKNMIPVQTKLSDKYRGFISKEEGQQLNDHINQMRSEWNNI